MGHTDQQIGHLFRFEGGALEGTELRSPYRNSEWRHVVPVGEGIGMQQEFEYEYYRLEERVDGERREYVYVFDNPKK